jgi:hypothetical protein
MTRKAGNRSKYASWTACALACATLAFSPVLFPAFAAKLNGGGAVSGDNWLNTYTAAGVDRKLAAKFKLLKSDRNSVAVKSRAFPFTPAGINRGAARTMTIATRTDSPLSSNALSSNAISTRNAVRTFDPGAVSIVQLNQTDFSLKAARGWQGFKLPPTARPALKAPVADIAVAAGNFRLDDKVPAKKSRFKTDLKLDQAKEAAPSPRGSAAAGEYRFGLESSFSLSRGIDLTAGVRVNSERDRVAPTVDERKDNEAVYVGTKIRF